jgi:hypothetical protein
VPVETFLSILTEEKLLSLVKSDTLVGIVVELGNAPTSSALSTTSPVFPFTESTAPLSISILP